MSLNHKFLLKQNDNAEDIYTDISDFLIRYIGDSLLWIETSWEGKIIQGLPYYSVSIINQVEIVKLRDIVNSWRKLFLLAPEEIILTGDYLPDDNKYEKIRVQKEQIQNELSALVELCNIAIEINHPLLYEGI